MGNNFDIWKSFWDLYPDFMEKIKPFAHRSAISTNAAILLILLFEYRNLTFPFSESYFEELENKGLIETKENKPSVTSKGEILSKYFCAVKNQIFKNWIKFLKIT